MIKQIILFIISFVMTLFLIEFYVRFSYISNRSSTEFYDDIGRGFRKNFSYVYFNEGFGIGRYNEFRYIGKNIPPEKYPNTIRIAIVGDSYVESFQVFERHFFGKITEEVLSILRSDIKFEVLNFGRSGFDLADMYVYQKTLIDKFVPDYILYVVANEDLYSRHRDLLTPYLSIVNDSIIINYDYNETEEKIFKRTKFLTQNFSILNMMNICRKKIKTSSVFSVLFGKIYSIFEVEKEKKMNDDAGNDPLTDKIIQSLDRHKTIFLERDSGNSNSRLKELCDKNRLHYISLNKMLGPLRDSGFDPNKWKGTGKIGHWNHRAHLLIGTQLAQVLLKRMEKNER